MTDLKNPTVIYIKAGLFLLAGTIAAGGLLIESPTLQTAVLIGIMVWSFSRAYYFAFYVLERYVDPGFRFSGLWSLARYLLVKKP